MVTDVKGFNIASEAQRPRGAVLTHREIVFCFVSSQFELEETLIIFSMESSLISAYDTLLKGLSLLNTKWNKGFNASVQIIAGVSRENFLYFCRLAALYSD